MKADLGSEIIDSQTYWFAKFSPIPMTDKKSVYLLPAYDEFLISYKKRSASFFYVNDKKVISSNGIFRPIIVVNGQVAGIWKRTIKKDAVIVKSELFMQPDENTNVLIKNEIIKYSHFLNVRVKM